MFEGYRSDMTRTFCVGGPPQGELARIFEVVLASQAEASPPSCPASRPKTSTTSAARSSPMPLADRFEHGTGHGVGLDIHEAPTVSALGTAILAPGVVVTVEPGVYIPASVGSASRHPGRHRGRQPCPHQLPQGRRCLMAVSTMI